MSTNKLTLAFQLVLGAVFGTALIWKQMRARERLVLASSNSGQWAGWAFDAERRQDASRAASRPAPGGGITRVVFGGVPDRVRFAILVFAAAAVPVLIGVTWAVTRSGSGATEPPQVNIPARTAPVASAPAAAATATLAEQWLDAHRAFDLATIRDAADAYAVYFRGYPTTNGKLTTLCVQSDDPGCAIGRYASSFPTSDGEHPYWYASDGETITLAAQVSSPPKTDDCPPGLTSPLGNVPVLCVTSSINAP